MTHLKTLIVYYSRTNNTKALAEIIQKKVGGDMVQLQTVDARPTNYRDEVNQNETEQAQNMLPKLKTSIPNFDSYDRIFIGAPMWNRALPQPVNTFLKDHDFNGKVVIPFNTNGGYGEGDVFNQIKSGASGARVLKGFSVKGGEETNGVYLVIKGNQKITVTKAVDSWLKEIRQEK